MKQTDIANTFFRAGFIESWGRGVEKICRLCKEYGIDEPKYTVHPNDIMMMFKSNDTEVIKEIDEGNSSKSGQKSGQKKQYKYLMLFLKIIKLLLQNWKRFSVLVILR